jgi:hypothetical protein
VITLGIRVATDVAAEASFRTATKDHFDKLDEHLGKIETSISRINAQLKLSAAIADPASPKGQASALAVLKQVRSSNIQLPSDVVKEAGDKFLAVARKSSGAWDTALSFAAYRSHLNLSRLTAWGPFDGGSFKWEVEAFGDPNNLTKPETLTIGKTTSEKGAFLRPFKEHQTRIPEFTGEIAQYALLDFHGGTIKLDGMRMRNIILRNTRIVYSWTCPHF